MRILYLIGRQGSGKTTLADLIIAGLPGAVGLTPDEWPHKDRLPALRAQYAAAPLLILEDTTLCAEVVAQLAPGDHVVHISSTPWLAS